MKIRDLGITSLQEKSETGMCKISTKIAPLSNMAFAELVLIT
jgi:hypothetical protein